MPWRHLNGSYITQRKKETSRTWRGKTTVIVKKKELGFSEEKVCYHQCDVMI